MGGRVWSGEGDDRRNGHDVRQGVFCVVSNGAVLRGTLTRSTATNIGSEKVIETMPVDLAAEVITSGE